VKPGRPAAAVLGLALVLLPAGCGGDSSSTDEPSGTTVSGDGYELVLPAGWTESDEGAPAPGTQVFFSGDPGAAFRTNLNVIAAPLPAGKSIDQVTNAGVRLIEKQLPEGKVVSGPDQAELDGEPADEIRYTASQEGVELRFAAIQALHEGTVYSLTLTSDDQNFEEAESDFERIAESWSWK
jgi:hypothetical protein